MFAIHFFFFFDCSVSSKNLLTLFLQRIIQTVLFSGTLITLMINLPRAAAVYIVSDILEISMATSTVKFSVKL